MTEHPVYRRVGDCNRCGACCTRLYYADIPDNFDLDYWKERGHIVLPDPEKPGNNIIIVEEPCKHIHINEDKTTYCDIHDTDRLPRTCKEYPPYPTGHFKCIKSTTGCGFDFIPVTEGEIISETIKEKPKSTITWEIPKEEGDKLVKKWNEEADALWRKMCAEGGTPAAFLAIQVFRDLVGKAERQTCNIATLDLNLEEWTENFKANLLNGYFKGYDNRWITDVIPKADTMLCVGAGPSLTDEQIETMRNFRGLLLCVNKSAKRLYEKGIVPDIITCIHGTDEVLPHFANDVVRENLHKSYVILCSTTHPKVTEEVYKYADPKKVYWFHASTPADMVANIDQLFQAFVNLPLVDTGGNVGLFQIALSTHFTPKALGFVGMELCQDYKDAVKTNQDMLESTYLKFPEDGQEFVLSKVFRAYTQVLMDWYGQTLKNAGGKFPFELFNLTPKGLIYVRRKDWIPYMPIQEFVQKYG